ncbi:hypothetical protein Hypma_014723 [Hypsizygus marmoreus]|uniref:Uncharacterized protein n=1 Tax=Hypsizygus marmoreus TaxID=39966 RepID=A0A369J990_HYPMA|nr:hypothetical protein Hypma_014723 [Hypsizygus marmoreus]
MLPHHSAQRIDKHRTLGYIPGPTESAALQSIASRAREKLRRLLEGCSALEQCANECDALLSPIRRLPPEILGAIFSHYPRDPDDPSPGVRIRAVCYIWRDVSRSIPDIWRWISVPFRRALNARRRKYESLRSHLQDTSYLLSISISKCTESEDLSMVRSLVDIADRWKTLYLHNAETLSHLPFVLTLSNLDFLNYSCHLDAHPSLPVMPRLSSLRFSIPGEQYQFSPVNLRLPWEQLRSLRVSGRAHNISDFLLCCRALTSFWMTVTDGLDHQQADDMPAPLPSVVASSLQSFSLMVCGALHPSSLEALLSSTILPAATNITLAHSKPLPSNIWPERELGLFLSHARSLEELTLIAIPISTNVLARCLGVTPQIGRLVLEANLAYPSSGRDPRPATINTEALLSSLAQNTPASNNIPALVPNLTSIEIHDSFGTGVKKELIAMVESRWDSKMVRSGTVKQLRRVALRLSDASLIPEVTALLRGFQQQGLDISVLPAKQLLMMA